MLGLAMPLLAQKGSPYATDPTPKTKNKVSPDKDPQKEKRYLTIWRRNTKGTLYGNRCGTEVTRKCGFEYVIVTAKQRGGPSRFRRAMHNAGVNFLLFFRNGPFWKFRLRKRLKRCRYQTGDYMG